MGQIILFPMPLHHCRLLACLPAGLFFSFLLMAETDPYLWLEEVEGEAALAWAREQNSHSTELLEQHPLFDPLHQRALEIITSPDRIPFPGLRGGRVDNFWRDESHVRGLWRTTSQESYVRGDPEWEILLDVDALAEKENENWVWAGSSGRYPDYDRFIIGLSRGGSDAVVRREFDRETRRFVEDGFQLPEAKSRISWRDLDSVFVGTDFGEDSLTDSGYPREVRLWRRGDPLVEAETVFRGERSDVSVSGFRVWDDETPYDLIVRAPGFFTRHYHLYRDEQLHRIHIPDDARLAGILDGRVLIDLKSDWTTGGETYRQGSLIATEFEAVLGEDPAFEVLYAPGPRASIAGVALTKTRVLVHVLDNVTSRLYAFRHQDQGWEQQTLTAPEMGTIQLITTDDRSDAFFYAFTGFLTPTTLFRADAAADEHLEVRSEPARFDASGLAVAQFEAESADGTRIPYFVAGPEPLETGGPRPTLLNAYGGFEISRTPFYSGVMGASWLERGGLFVLANIRGGGEFGPAWHQAALRENRQRAFDDFIAVAEDLIARGLTTPEQLGIQGGSNGGLLVGAAVTQRPDLFNAVVCQVPLLDMRRYHLLLAGASWVAEYGNPDVTEDWAFLSRYSPYQNVHPETEYPKIFFTTSTRDDRVHPAHARKMVAMMKSLGHDVLYYENIEGGHSGAANLRQQAYINSLIYAYLHRQLNPPE